MVAIKSDKQEEEKEKKLNLLREMVSEESGGDWMIMELEEEKEYW